jgi:hypothetical protein
MSRLGFVVRTLGVALLVSLSVAACATAGPRGRVYVRVAPPPVVVEARGIAPGPGHVWVGGYHRWAGDRYTWVAGGWVAPPRPRATWVPGHWKNTRQGHYWVEGHWR